MVVIIDYKMGNVASAMKALEKAGADEVLISARAGDIYRADHLVLPGVGAFGEGMDNIRAAGLEELLRKQVFDMKVPFLGICLGMQVLAERGFEFGTHKGLGWISGDTVKLEANGLHLPHVGWNDIKEVKRNLLLENLPDNNFYFVHSYHFKCSDNSAIISTCEYGQKFVAAVQKDNIFGVQFHPEKSQNSGIQLLKNFLQYHHA